MATLAMPDVVREGLGPGEQTPGFKIRKNALPGFSSIQPLIWAAICRDLRIFTDDADLSQTMPLAHFKVRGIVGRRNFDNTGPKCRIDELILDERNLPVHQRQDH